jgi:hypothetical protein
VQKEYKDNGRNRYYQQNRRGSSVHARATFLTSIFYAAAPRQFIFPRDDLNMQKNLFAGSAGKEVRSKQRFIVSNCCSGCCFTRRTRRRRRFRRRSCFCPSGSEKIFFWPLRRSAGR